jgi:hypothetical protein
MWLKPIGLGDLTLGRACQFLNKSALQTSSKAAANDVCRMRTEFGMCNECVQLDKKIEHYRDIAAKITDQLTIDRIEKLITDLQAIKVALHPDQKQ